MTVQIIALFLIGVFYLLQAAIFFLLMKVVDKNEKALQVNTRVLKVFICILEKIEKENPKDRLKGKYGDKK
jgi:hypothetical protein